MGKINEEHLKRGLYDFLQETDFEDVSYKGIFAQDKFRKALADFMSASFASNSDDEDRTLLIVASSEEEAREKFNKLLDTYEDTK